MEIDVTSDVNNYKSNAIKFESAEDKCIKDVLLFVYMRRKLNALIFIWSNSTITCWIEVGEGLMNLHWSLFDQIWLKLGWTLVGTDVPI